MLDSDCWVGLKNSMRIGMAVGCAYCGRDCNRLFIQSDFGTNRIEAGCSVMEAVARRVWQKNAVCPFRQCLESELCAHVRTNHLHGSREHKIPVLDGVDVKREG